MKAIKALMLILTASVLTLSNNVLADIMPAPEAVAAPVPTEDRIRQLQAEIDQLKSQIRPLKDQLKQKKQQLRQLRVEERQTRQQPREARERRENRN